MDTRKSSVFRTARVKRDALVAVVTAAGIAVAVWSYGLGKRKAQRSAELREHDAKVVRCLELGGQASRAVKVAVMKRVSKEEFEQLLGPIEPVDPSREPGAKQGDTHVYFHSPGQRTFYLRFTDQGLMDYHSAYGPDYIHIPWPAWAVEDRRTTSYSQDD